MPPNDRTAQGSHGEPVGLRRTVRMVHRPSPSSTIDEFDDNSRISRNIFAQVAKNKIELDKKINPK
jgi:hypothetical protein